MYCTLNLPSLNTLSLAKIGNKVFMNETSGNKNKLVFWNHKEEFPSMGICHFVWLPPDCNISFLTDTFSIFLEFCTAKGVIIPSWLQKNQKCPWKDRADFVRSETHSESWQMRKVRAFLSFHARLQTEFIIVNFLRSLPAVIDKLPEPMRGIEYCNLLLNT
jgi:hypothetical protein